MKILGKIINNIVTDVIVFSDEDFEKGMEHCKNLIKDNESTYVECINNAAIGWLYDGSTGTLYPPQPFPSWVLDSTFTWNAPLVYPSIISEGEGDLLVTYFIYWDEESYQEAKVKHKASPSSGE